MSGGTAKNRLAQESSPYLLLHQSNPVDWYPWGDEAFEKARREGKPVFLSVGYSTCYWCHVMERQSFSNQAIAAQLNRDYVSIKLDREERPELDEIYMTATQLLTRQGGWPNSVFLTADRKPFFAGTYFPPNDAHGRPGFPRVLRSIREAWDERREQIVEQAEAVSEAIREQLGATLQPAESVAAGPLVNGALEALQERFDADWGGFGTAPKFPSPSNLTFLLDLAKHGERARQMLVTTLDFMARGGIQDQLAGGFHRYSTDGRWLVPHFEKMLYDNAALARLYAAAAPLAPESMGFARVARRTLDFVLREMTGPDGGFLSAIDAETDGHEGAYYTWTAEELRALLSDAQRELLGLVYGMDGVPTFESDRFVLHLPQPLAARARVMGIAEAELLARLAPAEKALLAARDTRKRPLIDDKILTDWNGLMIGAMAEAGRSLAESRYLEAARRAASFLLERHQDAGGLLHASRNGPAKVRAFLDDYAFLIDGLIALHKATSEPRWLDEALRLQAEQDARLGDAVGGYFVAGEQPDLLFRSKAAHDGATASGNGVAVLNLLALGVPRRDDALLENAERTLRVFGRPALEHPSAHVTLAQAAGRWQRVRGRETAPVSMSPASEAPVVEASGALSGDEQAGWRPFFVELVVAAGWHVNANPASRPYLIPTEIKAANQPLRALRYPAGAAWEAADTLSVYRGSVRITGEIETLGREPAAVRVVYQPCDDDRCLERVTREIVLHGEATSRK